MRSIFRFIPIGLTLFYCFALSAQPETTFHVNGPDDYREGVHAFTNATIFKDYKTKIENATLVIRDGKVVDAGANVTDTQRRHGA